MSYVAIWKPVNDRIIRASLDTADSEIIGFLLGRLENDAVVITDTVTGEFSTRPTRATLPPATIAKIADDLVTGRVKGNILGWYHSHTEGGLFFSETDIETQKQLQQFSALVVGMVVDAKTGEAGYFRIDTQTNQPIRVPGEQIRVFLNESEALPQASKPESRPTSAIEVRQRPPTPRGAPTKLILAMVLVALIGSAGIITVFYIRGVSIGPQLTIIHNPASAVPVGTPLTIMANVTGAPRNVTLFYSAESGQFTSILMSSDATGQYKYEIPGGKVAENLSYYIVAMDSSGKESRTPTYHVQISDFQTIVRTAQVTVYPTRSVAVEVSVLPANGFSQQITMASSGGAQGLGANFSPSVLPAGTTASVMNITAANGTPNGTYTLTVTATYHPPQAAPVARQATVVVTVADFSIQASPSSRQVSKGAQTTFNLKVTIQKGFSDPVQLTVQGLPQGAGWQLVAGSEQPLLSGPGVYALTLQISTTSGTPTGTYTVTLIASGGGIVHGQSVVLIVR